MKRHILLVGLPGSGKSSIGARVAELLGTRCVDIDGAIVRRMQMPIERIFGERGEAGFRELEREAVAEALGEPPAVIVPGGGWAAQPGTMEQARSRAFLIYVKAPVTDAAVRTQAGADRPLLAGPDPVARMRALLEQREARYLMADTEVRNDEGMVEEAAGQVAELARSYAGW